MDSPAELFRDPWGTLRAGSAFPSFCIGDWVGFSEFAVPDVGDEPCRWNVCFALDNISRARDTPLLLLFGALLGVGSLFLRSAVGDALMRFSLPAFASSVEEPLRASDGDGTEASTAVVSSSFPGDVPNILFNRPPWLEKLLRLFPARLMV
jgi:hypothetical protein